MVLRVIAGGVASGKSTKVFEEIRDILDNQEDVKILVITGEYTRSYAINRIGYDTRHSNLTITDNVYPRNMGTLARWLLLDKPSYRRVYIDGFIPTMRDLHLINSMAEYSGIEEVVITMQTNRNSSNELGKTLELRLTEQGLV